MYSILTFSLFIINQPYLTLLKRVKESNRSQLSQQFPIPRRMQDDNSSPSMMMHFQNVYASMLTELERIQEEKKITMIQKESELTMLSTKLNQKTNYFESLINDKNKRIIELEDYIKKLQTQENDKNRRQIRRYVQNNNEKEAENNSLKRQINSLKNKINSLETEITNIANIKQDLELFIVKGIEQLKVFNKEMSNNIEETDTQKMVMQSKYKQTNEKMNMLTQKINAYEIKLHNLEENYGKMRNFFKQSKDQCLNQKFEIQQLKEKIRSLRLNEAQGNKSNIHEDFLANEVQGIIQLGNVLQERESFLKQVGDYHDMSTSLLVENQKLQQRICQVEDQLHQFKQKYVDGYQDQLLKKTDLSLFQYLQSKKQQFLKFEQIIEKIETYIEEKDETISKMLTNFSEKKLQCICGKQVELVKIQAEVSRLQTELEGSNSKISKIQAQLEESSKKSDHYQDIVQKMKRDQTNYQKTVSTYKFEIKDILYNEAKAKGKKKVQKKRCLNCFISIDKGDITNACSDCKRVFHYHCIADHQCELYKLDDGLSYMSGAEG